MSDSPWDDPSLTWGTTARGSRTVSFLDEMGEECQLFESPIEDQRGGPLLGLQLWTNLLIDQPQLAAIASVLQFFADNGRLPRPDDEGPRRRTESDTETQVGEPFPGVPPGMEDVFFPKPDALLLNDSLRMNIACSIGGLGWGAALVALAWWLT